MGNRILLGLVLLVFTSVQDNTNAQNSHDNQIRLIAHRGGVVDDNRAENSFSAIEEAIKRDYWMIEIDLRQSKDGHVLLHHDQTFERYYNDSRLVSEMTWSEVSRLKSEIDGRRPVLLKEAAELAKGQINLMLDIKGNQFPTLFYQKIEQILIKYNRLSSSYILGSSQAKSYFEDKAYLSLGYDELLEAEKIGERVGPKYYLFKIGSDLDKEKIQKANKIGLSVVAAINEFRYEHAGENSWEEAKKDIERLRQLGVKQFQIDSRYAPLFNQE